MVYACPIESELASGIFYDSRGSSFYLSSDKLESDYATVRYVRELRILRRYCKRGSILDVGCSTGSFLSNLQRQFPGEYSVTGTDVVSAALDYAESRGIQIIRSSFLDLSAEKLSFDAITFWAVIEHLNEPREFLFKAGSLLKPGGYCFILVPNLRSLAVRLLGPKYRYIMPDHINYFTSATLRSFATTCADVEVIHMTSTHFNPVVILKDLTSKSSRVSDSERAELLKRTTSWKQSRWLAPLRLIYSATERVLAWMYLADNLVIVLRKKV